MSERIAIMTMTTRRSTSVKALWVNKGRRWSMIEIAAGREVSDITAAHIE